MKKKELDERILRYWLPVMVTREALCPQHKVTALPMSRVQGRSNNMTCAVQLPLASSPSAVPLRNHLDKSVSETARGAVRLKVMTSRGPKQRGEG